ncbi:MAG: MBL fold metallo-hydrolase [Treponema sp.]|jgi:phosphoribosyl 1,2-cyclic phosphodiesterase|nr:MBL fold metallo-hydrolase [Treponema sp.]
MRINFWGVRGSLPSPVLPAQIKSKISAILEKATPEDMESAESRERFLSGLPPWLFGTVGGNTSCISVSFDDMSDIIVFDCGSGMREMGIARSAAQSGPSHYHIFLSHFHWDHILGLPFFNPAYDPSVSLDFYSPKPGLEENLRAQMAEPYFPVKMENMASSKKYHLMESPIRIGALNIHSKKMKHPGESHCYMINENGKRFIYATDAELSNDDFMPTGENTAFFKDADMIVLDCQYTLDDAIDKNNWGHNAFSLSVDFAANWGIKHLVMFHHDPAYSDRKLYGILQSARWYLERMNITKVELTLATEGLEISL